MKVFYKIGILSIFIFCMVNCKSRKEIGDSEKKTETVSVAQTPTKNDSVGKTTNSPHEIKQVNGPIQTQTINGGSPANNSPSGTKPR